MFSSLFIICNNFQSVTLILEQIWLGNSEIHLECLFRKITRITESEVIAWLDTNKNKWELDFKKKLSFKAPTVWARVANIPLDQTCTRHVQTNHGDKTNYDCNHTYLVWQQFTSSSRVLLVSKLPNLRFYHHILMQTSTPVISSCAWERRNFHQVHRQK